MLRSLVMIALMAAPVPLAAAPLQPTGPWHLYYQESNCSAERPFGDHMFGIQPSPLGQTMRIVIVGPGKAFETRQYDSLIELSDGAAPIKASSLVYDTSRKGIRGITTVLPVADAERVSKSRWLRISTLGKSPKSKRTAPTAEPAFVSEFAIGSTAALSRELNKCLADLQKHWGMVNGELPHPAKPAILSLQHIFRSEDYPDDAMFANQAGSTSFMLMIDETGKIIDCIIEKTSGVASIDTMGCQVIMGRAKAKPAQDASGKPAKSIYRAAVNWQIADEANIR